MPTGYTCIIEDNPNVTFQAFAVRCARAFGACLDMREDSLELPPPAKVEPSTYHRDQLEKAYASLRELETMTLEEADRRAEADYQRQLEWKREGEAKHTRTTNAYNAMLAKVEAWRPPTEKHEGLKKFMREQIELSISSPYDYPAHRMSPTTWLEHAKEHAAHDIQRHAEGWKKDQERAREATEWLDALRASLASPCQSVAEEKP